MDRFIIRNKKTLVPMVLSRNGMTSNNLSEELNMLHILLSIIKRICL